MNICKVEKCIRKVRAWGLCDTCYHKEVYHGRIVPQKQKPMEQRFLANIIKHENDCWEWRGQIDKHGYGRIKRHSKSILAHRLSYELNKAIIPKNKMICHTCDNPKCVNPEHLYVGDAKTNRQDCINRNRTNLRRGEGGRFERCT